LPALKRVIRVETLSQSAEALLPPHKCGGFHDSNKVFFRQETKHHGRDFWDSNLTPQHGFAIQALALACPIKQK
jgi:hypothetical protein